MQDGQFAVELSCKAIIVCFGEPERTHDPSEELLKMLRYHKSEIETSLGASMIDGLGQMAEDVRMVGWRIP